MTTLLLRAAPYLFMALLAAMLWLQRQTIASQSQTLAVYGEIIESRTQQLDMLAQAIARQHRDVAALIAQQDDLRADLDARWRHFTRLTHDNPEVRRWADTRLPDDVIRLRQHPVITGANAYAGYLRTRNAVPSTGEPGSDQRRPAAPH